MNATIMSRQLPTANKNERLGPVARPGGDERPPSMSLAQGLGGSTRVWPDSCASIWRNGLGSTTRDSSRNRDSAAFLSSNANGSSSSSFNQTLNTDVWNKPKSAWDSVSRDRNSGVSPVRRNSRLLEGTDVLGANNYTNGSRPSNGLFNNQSFAAQRNSETTLNGALGHFTRDSTGSIHHQGSISSWTEGGGSVHSPTDDRRSAASDSFMPYSNSSSQNPSQPPSRHGNNDPFFNESPFNRFQATHGHTPSVSSVSGGRFSLERQSSVSNDPLPLLERLSLSEASDHLTQHQRPTLDPQSPNETVGLAMNATYLQALHSNQAGARGAQNFGSYTPDNVPTFNNPFSRQPYDRGAFTPGANDFRPASYMSTPSHSDSSYMPPQNGRLSASANPALLERRLRSIQQEQTNGFPSHSPLQSSTLNPYRQPFAVNGFTPPYNLGNALPLGPLNLPPHLAGYGPPAMFPIIDPTPRGPREHDGMTLQSQLLTEFKATSSKGNRQWQLRDIQGHVVEFCGDQIGSRFIQTKLEQANSDDKQLVFAEILPDIIQLMQDVFGNYVIQKFFDHGDQMQKAQIAAAMKGHLFELSTQMYACRVVQKAIDHILTAQQAALIRELEPNVIRCVKDMNGNHVIQKAIERIPVEHIQFIVDAFTGKVDELSRHSYGCRVIQRVLEHSSDPVKHTILTELHNSKNIIDDQYGNYVTQHMIVFGFPEDREKVIDQIRDRIIPYSKHKFASNVVEKCFSHGSQKQKHELLMAIVNYSDDLGDGPTQLLLDGFGNYVIQTMLDTLSDSDWIIFYNILKPGLQRSKRVGPTSKQIGVIEKKMAQRAHLVRSDSVHSPPRSQSAATSAAASPRQTSLPINKSLSPAADTPASSSSGGTTAITPQSKAAQCNGLGSSRRSAGT
ncbi:hypothetical protein, variant [Verruconis gallopava]|uniref:PUM-HD domain-containing protein n=1 Tax=Verruconis gallopava TaxID=253628 RepID=A0A0D2AJM3_9PEZI|nr:uncharacterized protein PV09_09165 [Verruconis gallopava]XP_016209004.1 hypothetical protein, variant [Verruconis gallopava]KIV99133.1 hypothetical protein PV09_09165 [Verruconis gallopava]KIV99134.1 hypothetical protein, variant [Verruconis gallopava]